MPTVSCVNLLPFWSVPESCNYCLCSWVTLRSSNLRVKSIICANCLNSACCVSRCWRGGMSLEQRQLNRFGTVPSVNKINILIKLERKTDTSPRREKHIHYFDNLKIFRVWAGIIYLSKEINLNSCVILWLNYPPGHSLFCYTITTRAKIIGLYDFALVWVTKKRKILCFR